MKSYLKPSIRLKASKSIMAKESYHYINFILLYLAPQWILACRDLRDLITKRFIFIYIFERMNWMNSLDRKKANLTIIVE